ncbi:MAG: HIT domain-containing protein [Methylophaga sp.]|nr:HIT domain-containing protein [Methylophaga sp.]
MFKLAPRLMQDTISIGNFTLCKVLLMDDVRYPWVILVPRVTGLTEVFQLNNKQQIQLMNESNFVAEKLKMSVQADKMNVAALGNVVSQLHIHHVARFSHDETWPAPVWGKGSAVKYGPDERATVCQQFTQLFSELLLQDDDGITL